MQTILTSTDWRIARAEIDTAVRIYRIQYRFADSLRWLGYSDHLLEQLHARHMSEHDLHSYDLVITDFHFGVIH